MLFFTPSAGSFARAANRFTPTTPFEADLALAKEAGVSSYRDVSPSDFERLAASDLPRQRMTAARHPNIPAQLLDTLASDSNLHVVTAAASNRATTTETLDRIIEAENTASKRLRYRLGSKIRTHLLSALCTHPNMSLTALRTLYKHAGAQSTPGRYAKERLILKGQKVPAR